MNYKPPKLYFGPADTDIIRKGAKLQPAPAESLAPLFVFDFETTEIAGETILLRDKPALAFEGLTLNKGGRYTYFYKSADGVIEWDGNGKVKFPLGVGARTQQGKIIELGDTLAVVENEFGTRNVLKSTLFVLPDPIAYRMALEESTSFLIDLRKKVEAPAKVKIPNVPMGPAKPASPASPSTPAGQAGPMPQPSGKPGWLKKMFGGTPKTNAPAEPAAQEGTTKEFGPNDIRTLMRASNGELRWMSKDEVQQELQRRQGEKTVAQGKPAGHTFQVGQSIKFKGEDVEVISHADNVVAYKTASGKRGTFYASQYDKYREEKQTTQEPKKLSESKRRDMYARQAIEEKKQRQAQEGLRYNPKAQGEQYLTEQRAIQDRETETPEYKELASRLEKKGWSAVGGFEFEKEAERKVGEGISIKGKMRALYNPEKKSYIPMFNDRTVMLSHDGQSYQLADINGETLTLKNPETGEEKDIREQDLDDYRGSIRLDEEGNAFVEQKGKRIGQFEMATGVSQADLMSEGIIRIVNNEVWKRTKAGEGSVFNDTLLGRVDRGITFYKHGDETGIIGADRRTHIVRRRDTRRNIQGHVGAGLEPVQKMVKIVRGEIETAAQKSYDHDIVRSQIEGPEPKGQKPGPAISASQYTDVAKKFMKDGGPEMAARLADAYGTPEWTANVDRLAAEMKVEDGRRAEEVNAFNAMSKSGMLKTAPPSRSLDQYREAASELLNQERTSAVQQKYRQKVQERRSDTGKPKFERHDLAESPTQAKTISRKTMKIRDSRNREYFVQYAVVPMNSVVQSHDVEGKENPDHPTELQARKRTDASSTIQMKKIAENINDDVVTDSADATRGAPVAYSKGGQTYIVQGNGRTAGIKATTGAQRERYHSMVLTKAKELGLQTDQIGPDDMLVRVMTPKHTYQDALSLGAFGQESPALPLTEVEQARNIKNAGEPIAFNELKMSGVGNKPIDENNVNNFIRDNPRVYADVVKQSGYTADQIVSHPQIQARIVNNAMLAQLKTSFIEDIAGRNDQTQLLTKRIAPVLVDNQMQIAQKKLPEEADLQRLVGDVIKSYDGLDSATRNSMNVRNGKIDFLSDDEANPNPNTLIHRMRQEDLMSAAGKEENRFRDPLHVIGLIAYNEAAQPRPTEAAQQQAMTKFALKIRRLNEAFKKVGSEGEDIFGAQKTEAEKKGEQHDKLVKLAERILLENRTYGSEPEELSVEEQEAAKEQLAETGLHKRMRGIASRLGFSLAGETMKKSIWAIFRTTPHQADVRRLRKAIVQEKLFKPEQAEVRHFEGETRQFGPNDLRILARMGGGKLRWVSRDEAAQYAKQHAQGLQAKAPAHAAIAHGRDKQKIAQHSVSEWQNTFGKGDLVIHNNKPATIIDASEKFVALQQRDGTILNINRTSLNPDDTRHTGKKMHQVIAPKQVPLFAQKMDDYIYKTQSAINDHAKEIPQSLIDEIRSATTEERYLKPDGTWDASRIPLHEAFFTDRLEDVPTNIPDGEREAIIFAGGSGVGKSSVSRVLFGDIEKNKSHVWADSDQAKAILPEYKIMVAKRDFDGAGLVHRESTAMHQQLIDKAVANKSNLVVDGTLTNTRKAKNLIGMLKSNGYRIKLILVDGDLDFAMKNCIVRANKTGRMPPMEEIERANAAAPASFWEIVKNDLDDRDQAMALRANDESRAPMVAYVKVGKYQRIGYKKEFQKLIEKGKANEKDFTAGEYLAGGQTIGKPKPGGLREESEGGGGTGGTGTRKDIRTPPIRAVALKIDGKVYEGKPGDGHGDLLWSLPQEIQDQFENGKLEIVDGFIDREGKFKTRKEAADIIGQHAYDAQAGQEAGVIAKSWARLKKTMQFGLFGGAPAAPPMPMRPKGPKITGLSGVKWDRAHQEKPGHRYIRRYRGRDGEWRYVYKEGEREYVGDEKGKELPKHHDWKPGDTVSANGKPGTLVEAGDTLAVIRGQDGQVFSAKLDQVENSHEAQVNLRTEQGRTENKWQSLVDELEERMKTGEGEEGDTGVDTEIKLKHAREELSKHKRKSEEQRFLEGREEDEKTLRTEAKKHDSLDSFLQSVMRKIGDEEIGTAPAQLQYLIDRFPKLADELGLEDVAQSLVTNSTSMGEVREEGDEEDILKELTPENKKAAGQYLKELYNVEKAPTFETPPKDKAQYLSTEEMHDELHKNYYDDAGEKIASSRTKKPDFTKHALGTWRMDGYRGIHGQEIEQLREFDPSELKGTERTEDEPERMEDVDRYAKWIKEGSEPPPIHVTETADGGYVITNGHRRWLAAKKAGTKIKAWVSPTIAIAKGPDGQLIKVGMTYELANEPEKHIDPIEGENFKKWFGDWQNKKAEWCSKVVDKQGKPLRLYHSTNVPIDFEAFKQRAGDIGMHFGTLGQAEDRWRYKARNKDVEDILHVRIMPVYLSIEHPLEIMDVGSFDAENIAFALEDMPQFSKEEIRSAYRSSGAAHTAALRRLIESKGFDGLKYKNTGETGGASELNERTEQARKKFWATLPKGSNSYAPDKLKGEQKQLHDVWEKLQKEEDSYRRKNAEYSWVAFRPSQIKSAIGNNGAYDPKKKEITKSIWNLFRPRQTEPDEFLTKGATAVFAEAQHPRQAGGLPGGGRFVDKPMTQRPKFRAVGYKIDGEVFEGKPGDIHQHLFLRLPKTVKLLKEREAAKKKYTDSLPSTAYNPSTETLSDSDFKLSPEQRKLKDEFEKKHEAYMDWLIYAGERAGFITTDGEFKSRQEALDSIGEYDSADMRRKGLLKKSIDIDEFTKALQQLGMFDEAKHPRQPAGSEKGGEFAAKPQAPAPTTETPRTIAQKILKKRFIVTTDDLNESIRLAREAGIKHEDMFVEGRSILDVVADEILRSTPTDQLLKVDARLEGKEDKQHGKLYERAKIGRARGHSAGALNRDMDRLQTGLTIATGERKRIKDEIERRKNEKKKDEDKQ